MGEDELHERAKYNELNLDMTKLEEVQFCAIKAISRESK